MFPKFGYKTTYIGSYTRRMQWTCQTNKTSIFLIFHIAL